MKRSPYLAQLSREHHAALVLAKRAQHLGKDTSETAARFMTDLPEIFAAELEPHFQWEEDVLLPELGNAGHGQLVERTLMDHKELRALAGLIGDGDMASLLRFGDCLAAHVRFEERELFPVAEAVLAPAVLARVDQNPPRQATGRQTR